MTICWRVSLGKLKMFPQFRHMGIASRVATVLFVSPEQFCLLPPSSSVSTSTSEHEVMLTIILSRKVIGKDLSCMLGFNNPGSNRTTELKGALLSYLGRDLGYIVQLQDYPPIFDQLHDAFLKRNTLF